MSTRSLLVPVLAIVVGGLILFAGLAGVVFYVSSAVESAGEADQSGLFWFLPILFLGLGGMAAGMMLLVLGVGAARGSAVCARIARGALVFISLMALVLAGTSYLNERSTQREREARAARSAERERLSAEMQKIRRLDIREQPDGAIAVNVATTGGLAGSYELQLKVETNRGVLYRQASRLRLESSNTSIRRSISYRELFARCFDYADSGKFSACVKGAGTANTRFQLEAELRLRRATANARANAKADSQDRPGVFTTSSSASFFMDTFTGSDQVEIEDFRLAEDREAE